MNRYDKLETREEALAAVDAMNNARKARFWKFHAAYKQALAERTDPLAHVSPARVLELANSKSSSVYYVFLPIMELLEGVRKNEEPTAEDAEYQPSTALSAMFAPLRQQLELLQQAVDRHMALTVAGEAERIRGSFAQEKFSLHEALAKSQSRTKSLEDDLQQVAGESEDLAEQLAVAKSEKTTLEEQLSVVNELLSRAKDQINELSVRLQSADARITMQDDLDKVRGRELDALLAARDTLLQRLNVTEKDLHEQQQLREEDNLELRRLRDSHATEVAALREEFSVGVAAERAAHAREIDGERQRNAVLTAAVVEALKTVGKPAAAGALQ